jgi:hypothetical protein
MLLTEAVSKQTIILTQPPIAAFQFLGNGSKWFGVDLPCPPIFTEESFPSNLSPSSTNGLILALLVKLFRETEKVVPHLQDLCYAPLPSEYRDALTQALAPSFTNLLSLPSTNTFVADNVCEVAGRVRLNSMSLPSFSSSSSSSSSSSTISALYPSTVSFINHSCTPNAQISSSEDATLTLHSHIAGLPAGTEITIDYMGSFVGKQAKKKKLLFENYGFVCNCSLCSKIKLPG